MWKETAYNEQIEMEPIYGENNNILGGAVQKIYDLSMFKSLHNLPLGLFKLLKKNMIYYFGSDILLQKVRDMKSEYLTFIWFGKLILLQAPYSLKALSKTLICLVSG